MPRPGGSHGGGGRAGGGFGGGFGGGGSFGGGGGGRGFGGGPHRPHRPYGYGPWRPFGWGFGWYPRHYGYGYGGGCLGGLLGMMLAPIILILFAAMLLFSTIGGAASVIVQGGRIMYNEEKLQDYAYGEYIAEFGSSEDAILLVLLIENEEYYDFAYMPMVGTHVDDRIYNLFDSQGVLNTSIQRNIDQFYKYSLASDIADIVEDMAEEVQRLSLPSSFSKDCDCKREELAVSVDNRTELNINAQDINDELEAFKAATGIPLSIVIEDADDPDAFGRGFNGTDIANIVISVGMIITSIVIIVLTVRARKKNGQNPGANSDDGFEPPKL